MSRPKITPCAEKSEPPESVLSITWLSTLSPIRMLDEPISRTVVDCLIENRGVDSALLAAELKLCRHHVEAFQRRLGLRKCVPGTKALRVTS
jgi:hypothetical protein